VSNLRVAFQSEVADATAVGSKTQASEAVLAAFAYDLLLFGAIASNAIDDFNN